MFWTDLKFLKNNYESTSSSRICTGCVAMGIALLKQQVWTWTEQCSCKRENLGYGRLHEKKLSLEP